MFANNNPRIIESIKNHKKQQEEEQVEEDDRNRDYTEETDETIDSKDNDVNYNFNYESRLL